MAFQSSLSPREMTAYLCKQLNAFFPDNHPLKETDLNSFVEEAYRRTQNSFSNIKKKYYIEGQDVIFNHLHSDQMAVFLYYASNSAFKKEGHTHLPSKIYLLNKALHGMDAFYAVSLPEVFTVVHPVGTVLGNAKYGNFLCVYQNCGVGSDEDGIYPTFGEGIVLYAKASIIGKCQVGNNVVLAANTFVLNTNIPENSVVVGQYPNVALKPISRSVKERVFGL
jgi:serine O-acetyltransferase